MLRGHLNLHLYTPYRLLHVVLMHMQSFFLNFNNMERARFALGTVNKQVYAATSTWHRRETMVQTMCKMGKFQGNLQQRSPVQQDSHMEWPGPESGSVRWKVLKQAYDNNTAFVFMSQLRSPEEGFPNWTTFALSTTVPTCLINTLRSHSFRNQV
jgi:hypothetical protein